MSDPRRREELLVAEVLGRLDDCPEAGSLVRLQRGDLAGAEGDRLRAHLSACEACRTALEHPLGEDEPGDALPADVRQRSEEWIAAVRRPARGWMGPGMLRVAALLALGLGLALLIVPRLGEHGDDLGVPRGADHLQPEFPLGRLDALPEEMRWSPEPGAARYRVELLDAELRPVWARHTDSAAPSLRMDDEARAALEAGGRFSWDVQALDEVSRVIAGSAVVHFEIAPAGR